MPGAGSESLFDKLVQTAINEAKVERSLDAARERIEETIKAAHQTRLFQAYGRLVNEVDNCCSAGIGYYMADYIASRLFGGSSGLRQVVILAAYILHQAKEHVDGCGGQSDVFVLRNDGRSGFVDRDRIDAWTQLALDIDVKFGDFLLKHC